MIRLSKKPALGLLSALLVVSCAGSRLHQQGIDEFDKGRYEVGLQKLQEAVASDPANLSYKIDLKGRQEEAEQKLIDEGDKARAASNAAAAEAAYRRVLSIDNGNSRAALGLAGIDLDRRAATAVTLAQQDFQAGNSDQADARLRAVLSENPGYPPAVSLRAKIDLARGPVTVAPKLRTRDDRPVTLQFRDAQTKMVFEVLSRQTGINFIFDKDVKSDSKTTIFVQDVPIEQAIDLVLGQSQLSRQVLAENMVLIYPNTAAKKKDYEDQIVKTFYLNTAAPKDVETLLKTVLDAKTLVVNERSNAIVMRDTPENVRMAEKLVASIDIAEPEVMLEVEVLEINRSRMQQLGITYPGTATVSTPSGMVLNDLKNLNGSNISVTPFSATVDALKTDGNTNVLASPRIRARNNEKAKVLIGSREPVISTANSIASNGLGNSNTTVQYLDVGLTLQVEPTIYADNDVAIKLNLEVSSIIKQITVPTGNGGSTIAYEIGTRNADTLLQLHDGETQILAGLIRDSDTRSASKIPGLGDIPVLGRLFSDHNTDKEKTEIVLSITPRVLRSKPRPASEMTEFWYGTESRSGLAPLGAAASAPPRSADGASKAVTASPGAGAAVASINVDSQGSAAAIGGEAIVTTGTAPPPPGAPSARIAALQGITSVPSAKADDGPIPHPTATLTGPSQVKVGDEFTVTLQLKTDENIARARAQVRFDSAALQLLGGDPGSMVPSSLAAKVTGRAGGAQLEVASGDDPLSGSGDLMVLKFKALQPRPQSAVAAQISVMGATGVIVGSAAPAPLMLVIGN